jgi:hypothetical protein
MLHVTEINNNVLDITSFSLALLHLLRGFSWFLYTNGSVLVLCVLR